MTQQQEAISIVIEKLNEIVSENKVQYTKQINEDKPPISQPSSNTSNGVSSFENHINLSEQCLQQNISKLETLKSINEICSQPGIIQTVPIPTESMEKKLFKCPDCEYASHNKHYLKQHVDLVHNADRPFKCPFCDYAGKRSHSLKEHLVVHSNARPYGCIYCNATFRKKGHLTNHIKMHAPQKLPKCDDCVKKSADSCPHQFKETYVCKICEFATHNKNDIETHACTSADVSMYKCDLCGYTTVDSDSISKHIKIHESPTTMTALKDNSNKNKPVIFLKCSECGYMTDGKEDLKDHMWKHVAPVTAEKTKSDTVLTSRLVSSNQTDVNAVSKKINPSESQTLCEQVKHYCCTECNFVTTEAYKFITHMLSHKPKNFNQTQVSQVKNSDKLPKSTENMTQNSQFTHDASVGVYKCSICGYTCEFQRTIKAHIWKHTGHKDVDYPMFRNGPLSVYDDSPVIKPKDDSPKCKEVHVEVIAAHQNKQGLMRSPVNSATSNIELNSHHLIQCGTSVQQSEKLTGNPKDVFCVLQQSSDSSKHLICKSVKIPRLEKNILNRTVVKAETKFAEGGINAVNENVSELRRSKLHGNVSQKDLEKVCKNITENMEGNMIKMSEKEQNKTDQKPLKNQETGFAMEMSQSCNIEQIKPTANVVVQNITDVFSTPKFSMADKPDSPRSSHMSLSQISNSPKSAREVRKDTKSPIHMAIAENHKATKINKNCLNVDVVGEKTNQVKQETEPFVPSTLRSLLQKDKNMSGITPASSEVVVSQVQDGEETVMCQTDIARQEVVESENAKSNNKRQKSGICSSLLAVIEQMRSNSASEEDENTDIEVASTKPPRKRARRMSNENEEIALETVDNEERVDCNDGIYRCKLCHYSSSSTVVINSHMRMHKVKQPFECSLCDYLASSSQSLQDHMLQHCKMRTFQCKMCSAVFNYKSQLRAHMRAHNDTEPFICDLCDFETNSPVMFQAHMHLHTNKLASYKCLVCSVEFSSSGELQGHTCDSSRMAKILNCENCNFSSMSKEEMQRHMKLHARAYKCEHCDFTTPTVTTLQSHMQIHNEDRPLNCELCSFVASSMRSLKSHMKRHVNDQRFVQQPLEQYKCNMCGYVCHHLPSLKSHMWRHASDNNYCYQTTNQVINAAIDYDTKAEPDGEKTEMEKAEVVTEEEKVKQSAISEEVIVKQPTAASSLIVFRCCQCGFETVDKGVLNAHMKNHVDIIQMTLLVDKKRSQNLTDAAEVKSNVEMDQIG